ncbi:MAG: hypothetical protein AAFX39_16170 [Pseudomonadota bacterium]
MRVLTMLLAAVVMITGLATTPAPASAETLTFNVRSNHQYRVQLEFYSQWRDAAWPGNGQAYVIADYEVHAYTLNCQSGEQICYGAWVDGDASTYWGVGLNDQYGCSNCCYTCNGGATPVINLNP